MKAATTTVVPCTNQSNGSRTILVSTPTGTSYKISPNGFVEQCPPPSSQQQQQQQTQTRTVTTSGKRSRVHSKDSKRDGHSHGGGNSSGEGNHNHKFQARGGSGTIPEKSVSIESDLRNMMHAFGDSYNPSNESINTMESILKQELQGFVTLCDYIASLSGSKTLEFQEPIFVLKNERSRLIRLLKYFTAKEKQHKAVQLNQISHQQNQGQSQSQTGGSTGAGMGAAPAKKSSLEEIRIILDRLDESGEYNKLLESSEYVNDTVKTERSLSSEKICQRLNYPKYLSYSKARAVSFARKPGKLQDWVGLNTRSEFTMTSNFMDVLSFLAYEIVCQMIDLAVLVRRERIPTTNLVTRLAETRAVNPETCMSAPVFKNRRDQCNSVSEILVQASELEAKRLKKVASKETVLAVSDDVCITPNELMEAYIRLQRCVPPPLSYKVRAEKLRRINPAHYY